jgi:glyoxylase-like metal-dependent hydrolase (beta-lactamase superfamily II)
MISLKDILPVLLLTVLFLPGAYAQKISKSVFLEKDAVNGVLIERNGERLVVYGDPSGKVKKADMVLFTHFRRDVVWAGRNLVNSGSQAIVPAMEKNYFTNGDSVRTVFNRTRFHDYYCQTTKIGMSGSVGSRFVRGGDLVKWQNIDIKVLDTPGYTRGSVSYIADIDGKRYAFTGDLIYGDGRIMDLYSFQDSLRSIGGYHGYAVRLGQLVASLQLIARQKPDLIIPCRGPVITEPLVSIQKLIERIQSVYRNYLSISAYRWYYPERMKIMAQHVIGQPAGNDGKPFSAVIEKDPPAWYMHIGNSNLVLAGDSSAFLIDCGTKGALERIKKLRQAGRLKSIDGIFITHYHDDHTDIINEVIKEFGCRVYITGELKDILQHPEAYHMPCLTANPITDLTVMQDGQKITWKDFDLTFRFFPGQTLYHDALLVEKRNGETVFFIGDSFTPSGVDDYCLLNRNLLHPGYGYSRCIEILKKLPEGVLLANQHVEPLFSFSSDQLGYLEKMLSERNAFLKDLFPWDDINYGVDGQWIRYYPYGQKVKPGQITDCSVKIMNHSGLQKRFVITPVLPDGFSMEPMGGSLVTGPLEEGEIKMKIKIPGNISPGIYGITANVKFDGWDLHEWCETLLEVIPR